MNRTEALIQNVETSPRDLLRLLEKRKRNVSANCIGGHCNAHCHGHAPFTSDIPSGGAPAFAESDDVAMLFAQLGIPATGVSTLLEKRRRVSLAAQCEAHCNAHCSGHGTCTGHTAYAPASRPSMDS